MCRNPVVPYGGSTYLLSELVVVGRRWIYLASQPISAECAQELGLVSQVCSAQDYSRHTMETALHLAHGQTMAYARIKALLDSS